MQLDDIPIHNKARDAAWAAFIKRKDVQEFFADKDDTFRFPLERGWYEVWCQAWEQATKRSAEVCEQAGIEGYGTLATAAVIRARSGE